MIDQLSQTIEDLATSHNGSYIDAIMDFAKQNHIEEFEELILLLHPIIIDKIKMEFIAKNHFPGMKIENSIKDFFN